MSRLIYYVAATLDGYIADPDDALDWLFRQEQEPGGGNDYEAFAETVGALVMGSTTYEWVRESGPWAYALPTWVMTHRDLPLPTHSAAGASPEVRFSADPLTRVHAEMGAAAAGKDLWVVGGGDLAGQFADLGLLDEVWLSLAPVTLGAGRPLLPRRLDLELVEIGRNGALVTTRHRVVGPLREDQHTPA